MVDCSTSAPTSPPPRGARRPRSPRVGRAVLDPAPPVARRSLRTLYPLGLGIPLRFTASGRGTTRTVLAILRNGTPSDLLEVRCVATGARRHRRGRKSRGGGSRSSEWVTDQLCKLRESFPSHGIGAVFRAMTGRLNGVWRRSYDRIVQGLINAESDLDAAFVISAECSSRRMGLWLLP